MWEQICFCVLFAVMAVIISVGCFYTLERMHHPAVIAEHQSLVMGTGYTIKHLEVLQAHQFDVVLENDKRYLVELYGVIGSNAEAKGAVEKHLNQCREKKLKPTLVPRSWDKDHYVADIIIGESTLTDWLYAQNLAYSK